MNEELRQQYLANIRAETDPDRRAQLMNDMAFAMTMGQTPDLGGQFAPSTVDLQPGQPLVNKPSVYTPTYAQPAVKSPTDVATGTVGDFKNPYAGMTAQQFMDAVDAQNAQIAAASAQAAQDGRDDPARFMAQPTVDANQELFGQTANQLAAESLLMRSNMIRDIEQQMAEYTAEANAYRTGEKRVQRSGMTDKLEIATTPEDFARIKAEGKIPIAARDAQTIIENARREANALLRSGEAGVATAGINRMQIAGNQIATGIGSGLASALTGVNVGAENLSAIRSQAENARQQLLNAIQQRRTTQVGAESLNSKARIDAMIAQLEPMQAISQLIQADELDAFQRQVQAQRDAEAKAEAARMRLEQIKLQEPQFKASLHAFSQAARTPIPGQFVAFPTPRAGSTDPISINQNLDAAITNAAKELQSQLDVIKQKNDIFVDESETTLAINRIAQATDDIIGQVNQFRRSVQIHPLVTAKLDALVNLKSEVLNASRLGKSSWFNDETGVLDDRYKDNKDPIVQSLDFITRTPIFGASPSSPSATGAGEKKIDFSGF